MVIVVCHLACLRLGCGSGGREAEAVIYEGVSVDDVQDDEEGGADGPD